MSDRIVVHCFYRLSAAAPWREAINALNLASDRPDPFSSYEFYDHTLSQPELFPPGARLWLLLACQGEQLLGCLPLRLQDEQVLGLRARRLGLLTAHVSDRPRLVVRPGDEQPVSAAIYDYLLSRRSEWSLLEFQQQDAATALLPLPPLSRLCRHRQWPNQANGNIAIRWESLAGYFAALSKKFRSNLSRQMRLLLAAGEVELLASSDPETMPVLFELYCSIESHSWKAHTRAGFGNDARLSGYYTGLMAADQPMQLSVQVLLLDGLPIAGLICGGFGSSLYALHIVYDDRLARLAPGSAILFLGVRTAIAGGYGCFSLLWGYGYYKSRWLAEMSETRSVQIYQLGSAHFLRRLLGDLDRSWRGKANAEIPTLSNPARDEVDKPEATLPDHASISFASREEREGHAVRVRQVRAGRGEFLGAAQLSALMPFETRQISPTQAGPRAAAEAGR